MERRISEILSEVREVGRYYGIQRTPLNRVSEESLMEIIETIGKSRNPRFVIDDNNRFVYQNLVKWLRADPSMQAVDPASGKLIAGNLSAGIYLCGPTGVGKSWALDILSSIGIALNINIMVANKRCCLGWETYSVEHLCNVWRSSGTIDSFVRLKIIGIEDLGREPEESVYMGNRLDVVRSLLESRGDIQDNITVISSNYPLNCDFMRNRYGERVISRLTEKCNYLILKGADRRLIK